MANLITLLMSLTLTVHMVHNGEKGACTAVWISETEALTAGHCIESPKDKIWVHTDDNKSFSASLERLDTSLDLCLLKIYAPKHLYAELGNFVSRGDRVFIMTSGNDMANTYGEGIVENILDDLENGTLSILHSAAILPGASGSGLFNAQGQLVGLNTAMYHSITSAVDETEIQYFLSGKRR